MDNIKQDIDLLFELNSADLSALEDAQITLESIKKADPGTYDEIIDESLKLIKKALSISPQDCIERLAKHLGVNT